MRKIYWLYIPISIFLFLRCGQQTPDSQLPNEAESDHQHDMEEMDEDLVMLTKVQTENIMLQMGKIQKKPLRNQIKVSGILELPAQNKAQVSSSLDGKVKNIAIRPGQFVKKGQILATLQNPQIIDWKKDYLEAVSNEIYLVGEKQRLETLVSKDLAAEKDLQRVLHQIRLNRSKKVSAASYLKSINLRLPMASDSIYYSDFFIFSPIQGFVKTIHLTSGTQVLAGQHLVEIVDNHHIHLDLKVFESDLPKVKIGQKILFRVHSKPSEILEATVFAIGKAMDRTNKTITVHAEMHNDKNDLVPGMFVEAWIVENADLVDALPPESIATDKGLNYVFTFEKMEGDHIYFRKRLVNVGLEDMNMKEVIPIDEIPQEAQYVTEGAYFLMAHSKKGEVEEGHHH